MSCAPSWRCTAVRFGPLPAQAAEAPDVRRSPEGCRSVLPRLPGQRPLISRPAGVPGDEAPANSACTAVAADSVDGGGRSVTGWCRRQCRSIFLTGFRQTLHQPKMQPMTLQTP